jgi:hypothetical protein
MTTRGAACARNAVGHKPAAAAALAAPRRICRRVACCLAITKKSRRVFGPPLLAA